MKNKLVSLMNKTRVFFDKLGLEVLIVFIEIIVIGLSQILFEYGSMKIYILVYVLARFHDLTKSIIRKTK